MVSAVGGEVPHVRRGAVLSATTVQPSTVDAVGAGGAGRWSGRATASATPTATPTAMRRRRGRCRRGRAGTEAHLRRALEVGRGAGVHPSGTAVRSTGESPSQTRPALSAVATHHAANRPTPTHWFIESILSASVRCHHAPGPARRGRSGHPPRTVAGAHRCRLRRARGRHRPRRVARGHRGATSRGPPRPGTARHGRFARAGDDPRGQRRADHRRDRPPRRERDDPAAQRRRGRLRDQAVLGRPRAGPGAAVLRRGRPVEPGPPRRWRWVRCGSTSAPAPPASTGSHCGWRARSSTCCATSPSAPAGSYPGPSCS